MSGGRHLTRSRRRVLAACCVAFGILLWIAAIALRPAPANTSDVNIPHIQARLLGIIIGGASIAAGIIVITAG